MPIPTPIRLVALLAALLSGAARAGCVLQQPALTPIRYVATREFSGTLNLSVVCDAASSAQQYTLSISAPGGRFDQASGAYLLGAPGRADSVLQVQISSASPSLGGSAAQTVYTGSQSFDFTVLVPAGQWQARGTPITSLTFELTPFVSAPNTGNTLP